MGERQERQGMKPLLGKAGSPEIEAAHPGQIIVDRAVRGQRAENDGEEGEYRAEPLSESIRGKIHAAPRECFTGLN
jgi:hypothetical protein